MYDTSRQSGFCVPKCLQMCCCTERYDGRLRVYFGHFDFSIPDNFMGIWAVSTKWCVKHDVHVYLVQLRHLVLD